MSFIALGAAIVFWPLTVYVAYDIGRFHGRMNMYAKWKTFENRKVVPGE